MTNLTKLYLIKTLINQSQSLILDGDHLELNEYIKTLIKIEEFTPEYTTIEPI